MLVQKEAITIPMEAKRPPTNMTGRQPKRLTHTLHSGPGKESKLQLQSYTSFYQWFHVSSCFFPVHISSHTLPVSGQSQRVIFPLQSDILFLCTAVQFFIIFSIY